MSRFIFKLLAFFTVQLSGLIMPCPHYNRYLPEAASFTLLLHDARHGDKLALDRLLPLVYAELRRLADSYLRNERGSHTLQPTALVHEAYIRLAGQNQPDYQNHAHFRAVAAQVMRQILVDHARRRNASKRGSGMNVLSLEEGVHASDEKSWELVALDDALSQLANDDQQKARFIELRYFGGLTVEEIAGISNLHPQAVYRELRIANALIRRAMAS